MAVEVFVDGHLTGDPEVRVVGNNKSVLNFDVGATMRRLDEQTDTWYDVGEPLFLKAALWDNEVARWADHLRKGVRVTFRGMLKLDSWQARDGETRQSFEVVNVKMGGVIPKHQQSQQQPQQPWGGQQQPQQPWGGQQQPQQPWGGQQQGQFNQAPAGGQPNDPWAHFGEAPPQQQAAPPERGAPTPQPTNDINGYYGGGQAGPDAPPF